MPWREQEKVENKSRRNEKEKAQSPVALKTKSFKSPKNTEQKKQVRYRCSESKQCLALQSGKEGKGSLQKKIAWNESKRPGAKVA